MPYEVLTQSRLKRACQATWLNLNRQKTEQAVQLYEQSLQAFLQRRNVSNLRNDTLSPAREPTIS